MFAMAASMASRDGHSAGAIHRKSTSLVAPSARAARQTPIVASNASVRATLLPMRATRYHRRPGSQRVTGGHRSGEHRLRRVTGEGHDRVLGVHAEVRGDHGGVDDIEAFVPPHAP